MDLNTLPHVWSELDRIELERIPFARGGFGTVYKAETPNLKLRYAVKICHPNQERDISKANNDLESEAKILLEARKRGLEAIVQIHDFGQIGDHAAIAMEYLPGFTLNSLVEKQNRLKLIPNPRYSLLASISALRGIAQLLSIGYHHRDISADQFKCSSNGQYKTLDVGCSIKSFENVVTGKPTNLAPEIFDPNLTLSDVDKELADVYAFGLMMHKLFYGRHPFKDLFELPNQHARIKKRMESPHPTECLHETSIFPHVPENIRRVITTTLSPEPNQRPRIQNLLSQLYHIATEINLPYDIRAIDQYNRYLRKRIDGHKTNRTHRLGRRILDTDPNLEPLTTLTEKGPDATFSDLDYNVETSMQPETFLRLVQNALIDKKRQQTENLQKRATTRKNRQEGIAKRHEDETRRIQSKKVKDLSAILQEAKEEGIDLHEEFMTNIPKILY